jgi:hypothetical protein
VKDGVLVPVPREQAAIRRMIKLRDEGTSLREIAAVMKRIGFELSHYGVDKIIKAAAARKAQETAAGASRRHCFRSGVDDGYSMRACAHDPCH